MVTGGHARTARVLLMMVIPGHLIFSYTISYIQAGHTSFTPIFITIYLIAAMLQVNTKTCIFSAIWNLFYYKSRYLIFLLNYILYL